MNKNVGPKGEKNMRSALLKLYLGVIFGSLLQPYREPDLKALKVILEATILVFIQVIIDWDGMECPKDIPYHIFELGWFLPMGYPTTFRSLTA